jgi:hypothetical protein
MVSKNKALIVIIAMYFIGVLCGASSVWSTEKQTGQCEIVGGEMLGVFHGMTRQQSVARSKVCIPKAGTVFEECMSTQDQGE